MSWNLPPQARIVTYGGFDFTWAGDDFPLPKIALIYRASGSTGDWTAVWQSFLGDAELTDMQSNWAVFLRNWIIGPVMAALKAMFKPGAPQDIPAPNAAALAEWLRAHADIASGADGPVIEIH